MEDTACPHCGFSPLPGGARFCQQCGGRLPSDTEVPGKRIESQPSVLPALLWPVCTIVSTLALSWFLISVLHWPVFILGAFLPLAWKFSKKP